MTHLRSIIFIIVKKVVVSNFDENGIHFICNDLWKKKYIHVKGWLFKEIENNCKI